MQPSGIVDHPSKRVCSAAGLEHKEPASACRAGASGREARAGLAEGLKAGVVQRSALQDGNASTTRRARAS